MQTHHDVVVIGAGNAGISLAAKLLHDGAHDLVLVDPSQTHTYQPLLSYVGSGAARLEQARRPQRSLIPAGCRWVEDAVVRVDPQAQSVHTSGGHQIGYTDLVVCPGVTPDWDAMPGSAPAMAAAQASTNYLPELAPKTWRLIETARRGTAVFTVPDRPVPCGGVAYKPLFGACDHWRRTGVLADLHVVVLVESPQLFGIPLIDRELGRAIRRYGIDARTGTAVREIRPDTRSLLLEGPGGPDELHYDLLHLTPEHRAPLWIAESGLAAGASGFVDVDEATLQHRRHPNLWGLGDAAATNSSRSGGALRRQVPVVAHNIAARRLDRPMRRYDGYSVAPITTSRRSLLLAEFDRQWRLTPSLGISDLARSRPWTYLYDRHLQPQLYWHSILRGRV